MFDVCTTGDTAHIDTTSKFLPHTRQHGSIDILHCCNDPCELLWKTNYWEKKVLSCSFYLYSLFRKYVSFGFLKKNFIIPEYIMKRPVHYETPCTLWNALYIMKRPVHYETPCTLRNALYITKRPVHYETPCTLWNALYYTLKIFSINPLNAKSNPICHLLALLGAHHILHVSGLRVNLGYVTSLKYVCVCVCVCIYIYSIYIYILYIESQVFARDMKPGFCEFFIYAEVWMVTV
jgi:hypothetical protein